MEQHFRNFFRRLQVVSVPGPVLSKNQGFVVSQHMELPPLQQEPEVAQGGHHHQELPIKGAVSGLSVGELPAEGGEDCHSPPGDRCCRAAPTWWLFASTARESSASWMGWARWVASVRAALATTNAFSISLVHSNWLCLLPAPRVASVSGLRMLAAPRRCLL